MPGKGRASRTTSRGRSELANLSVVGLQWGDEGKGKVVDYLADGFDAVVRFNGGSNAGHTVVIDGQRHTFHLIPSGALKGKELLVGAGVAVDPAVMGEELSLLPEGARGKLTVDGRCLLVSPMDKELDSALEEMRGPSAIGTTRRGIGPAYAMRALRLSPRASDLLASFDFSPIESFYRRFGLDPGGLDKWAEDSRQLLAPMIGDAAARVVDICDSGGSVLYESSQGTLLDLVHGSYPYVTSTHTVSSYAPAGIGLSPSYSGTPLGVMKCYLTRVGGGPFPTEVAGELGESLRSLGKEYGATTGRPRRVGWLDLVSLKYSMSINGVREVALSKLDVLSKVKEFKVCVAYKVDGSETTDFGRALPRLGEAEAVYGPTFAFRGAEIAGRIPEPMREFIDYLEAELKVRVRLASYGEDRTQTIEL